ncbi:hypothetical protein [Brucella intermedia]|uniref:hypothetical protein n=1 Tax=Brucella intermedia TaxID=94625 RepID=UPI00235DD803|nr:hypothetical protein [Brucella intermedia]
MPETICFQHILANIGSAWFNLLSPRLGGEAWEIPRPTEARRLVLCTVLLLQREMTITDAVTELLVDTLLIDIATASNEATDGLPTYWENEM